MGINLFYEVIFVIAAYLFGSIPTAYIIYRFKKGGDIRDFGSGNVGGTNVVRTVGVMPGIITMLADTVKGFLPVLFVYIFYPQNLFLLCAVSMAVILGHDFPVYIKFKGGKGIASSSGVVIGICSLPFIDNPVWLRLMPIVAIIMINFIIFAIFKIVSLSSLSAALITPLAFYFSEYPLLIVITSVLWSIVAFITHRDNIKRLIRKEEKKIWRKGV